MEFLSINQGVKLSPYPVVPSESARNITYRARVLAAAERLLWGYFIDNSFGCNKTDKWTHLHVHTRVMYCMSRILVHALTDLVGLLLLQ